MSQTNSTKPMAFRERMAPFWQGGWLVLLVFLAYVPALKGGFVWDDDSWTTRITGLLRNPSGLYLMWFQPTALQQYYPLSGTTFWLDYHFWGFWTTPYHVENILLHALGALLFWRLLRQLELPGAWLAAAIFALHPVMVESVAWITERKNVLSLVFYLGSLLAYTRYAQSQASDQWRVASGKKNKAESGPIQSEKGKAEKSYYPSAISPQPSSSYGLAFVLFLGALLAKTTTLSLPAVILLLAWWKSGKIRWRADVLPTLPFFALALGLCAVTAWLEKNHVGAQGADFALTFPQRCLVAGRAFWFYLGNLFWPADLCFIYPRWQPRPQAGWEWLYPITALGTLFALWLARARIGRGPVTALFYFVGTLFPVLGFINAYGMRYSYVWDHWVYLSTLGIITLVVAFVVWVAESLHKPAVVYGFGAVVLPVFILLTWRQAGMFQDMETLWRATLAKNPECVMAHNDLGVMLKLQGRLKESLTHFQRAYQFDPASDQALCNMVSDLVAMGDIDEAIKTCRKALQHNPNSADTLNELGNALTANGQIEEAIKTYREAIERNPDLFLAHYNLGNALAGQGRLEEAIASFYQAVQIAPNNGNALNNLGNALAMKGRLNEAIKLYRHAIRVNPNNSDTLNNLGLALAAQGRLPEAATCYQQALLINSNRPDIFFHLGMTLGQIGRTREAVDNYRAALKLNPDLAGVLNNLALALATSPESEQRDGVEAVQLAKRACELTRYNQPYMIGTLAAAYAEAGDFPEAVTMAEKAEQLAKDQGLLMIAEKNRQLLELYRAGKPDHEPPPQ